MKLKIMGYLGIVIQLCVLVKLGNSMSSQNQIESFKGSETELGNGTTVQLTKTTKASPSPGTPIVQDEKTIRDYQTNGGDERHLWVLPDGTVHAVYYGRTLGSLGRGSFYVYSSNNGVTFSEPTRVELMTADFPSMDVTSDGRAVIASHTGKDPRRIHINVDSSPGAGNFTQFNAPDKPINCIWPRIAVASDTNFVFWGSEAQLGWPDDLYENSWNTINHFAGTFGTIENKMLFPGVNGEISGTIARSTGGKVAIPLINYAWFSGWYGNWGPFKYDFGEGNIIMRESTDGGISLGEPINISNNTLDTTSTNIIFGPCISALYKEEELHIVWTEAIIRPELFSRHKDLRIVHWSKNINNGVPIAAVRWDSLHFSKVIGAGGYQGKGLLTGLRHMSICNPTIGMDEEGILTIAFTGFSGDTTNADPVTGFAYGDIWAVSSADNGFTWGEPTNLTNSPERDDRYPYISTWNEAGKINVLYQTDTRAGCQYDCDPREDAIGDVNHLFLKTNHPSTVPSTAVEGNVFNAPSNFSLSHNYPNPFNSTTIIEFSLANKTLVTLEIVDLLGRRIDLLESATLDEGKHNYVWEAGNQPSGVYFYRLTSEHFSQTRKMLLVR
jgi:hypothetical protein